MGHTVERIWIITVGVRSTTPLVQPVVIAHIYMYRVHDDRSMEQKARTDGSSVSPGVRRDEIYFDAISDWGHHLDRRNAPNRLISSFFPCLFLH